MANDSRPFHGDASKVIEKLRGVLTDPYCKKHMNMSSVAGFLGELLVGRVLHDRGYHVEHLGRQHGSDLRLREHDIEIDVKTSLLKHELGSPHWGWALVSGSKRKALTFTHLVCVALDATLEPSAFFVVKRQVLERFPAGIRPFKNNKRILLATQDGGSVAGRSPEQRAAVAACAALRDDGIVQYALDADSLLALLELERIGGAANAP